MPHENDDHSNFSWPPLRSDKDTASISPVTSHSRLTQFHGCLSHLGSSPEINSVLAKNNTQSQEVERLTKADSSKIEDTTPSPHQKDGYDDLIKLSISCFEHTQSLRHKADEQKQVNSSSTRQSTQSVMYVLRKRVFAEAHKAGYGKKDKDNIVRLMLLKDGSLTKEIDKHLKAEIYRNHLSAVKHLLNRVQAQEDSIRDKDKRQEYSRLLKEHKAKLDEYREAYAQYRTEIRQQSLKRKYYPLIGEGFKCGFEPEQLISILFLKHRDSIQYVTAAEIVSTFPKNKIVEFQQEAPAFQEKRLEYEKLIKENKKELDECQRAYRQYKKESVQKSIEGRYYSFVEELFKCGFESEKVIDLLFLRYKISIQYVTAATVVLNFPKDKIAVLQQQAPAFQENRIVYERLIKENEKELDECRRTYLRHKKETIQRSRESKYYPLVEEGFRCGLKAAQIISILFLKYKESIKYSTAVSTVRTFPKDKIAAFQQQAPAFREKQLEYEKLIEENKQELERCRRAFSQDQLKIKKRGREQKHYPLIEEGFKCGLDSKQIIDILCLKNKLKYSGAIGIVSSFPKSKIDVLQKEAPALQEKRAEYEKLIKENKEELDNMKQAYKKMRQTHYKNSMDRLK